MSDSRPAVIDLPAARLHGELAIPASARGLVLFAHGSGSGRKSPRNRAVAAKLNGAGLATLLFDLLTRDEEEEDSLFGHLRFDIPLLSSRLVGAIDWTRAHPETRGLELGVFGASTGAAAALMGAAARPADVVAVVSRGGRPDLAGPALPEVRAASLLIVGELDDVVLELNRAAFARLVCVKALEVVPGATHLFEEPGALDIVARLATDWFAGHFAASSSRGREAA